LQALTALGGFEKVAAALKTDLKKGLCGKELSDLDNRRAMFGKNEVLRISLSALFEFR
jgi:hypothetical protein